MDDKELREKTALIIKSAVGREMPEEAYLRKISIANATDQILALIKEAGYVKLMEDSFDRAARLDKPNRAGEE